MYFPRLVECHSVATTDLLEEVGRAHTLTGRGVGRSRIETKGFCEDQSDDDHIFMIIMFGGTICYCFYSIDYLHNSGV